MFATLLGPLPRPPLPDDAATPDLLRAVIDAQVAAGLDPVTDGGVHAADPITIAAGLTGVRPTGKGRIVVVDRPARRSALTVDTWRATAAVTTRSVKQILPGPYTLGRRVEPGVIDRRDLTLAFAEALNEEIVALAAAGCPLVEVHEPDATAIGDDTGERALFVDAHRRLTDGTAGIHLALAITGGSADTAGARTILDAPYASLAVDLIAGPDNWRLVTALPRDRGVVVGALAVARPSDPGPEVLAWALHYAAAANGRGTDRVGLAPASGLAHLRWEAALTKLRRLAEGVRLAGLPRDELAAALDPRAVDLRSAALGRYAPRARSRQRSSDRRR